MLLSAAFGLALAASPTSPVFADNAPGSGTPTPTPVATTNTDVDALKKQVEDLKRDLKDLKEFHQNTEAFLYGKNDGPSKTDGVMRRLASLEEKMKAVQDLLIKLDDKLTQATRVAGSSPLNNGNLTPNTGTSTPDIPKPMAAPGITGAKGTIRIVNEYPTEVSLLLNGKAYRVESNEVKSIEIPAGNYSYELLQSGAQAVSSSIKDSESVTLRIR